jgi:cytochrome c556
MTGPKRALCFSALACALLVLTLSCSTSNSAPASSQKPTALWGDMKPIVSVKELMADMIDPASDYVFDAIGTIINREKTTEIQPRTDEDWARIRAGAVMMAEGVYLLKVPRPFAPVGDENNSTGPEPEELSPAQITAKLEKDPVLWNAKIEALRNVGLEVLDIVKKKDTNALWDACEDLDAACENCHLEFWYPGERAYLSKLDRRLDELYGKEHKTGFGRAKIGMEPPASKK